MAHACGHPHPALIGGEAIDLSLEGDESVSLWEHYRYDKAWWEPISRRSDELVSEMYPSLLS